MRGKFEVDQNGAGEWFWRLKSKNSKILAHSESFRSERDARRAAETAKKVAKGASVTVKS
jgi:uncharacterized protein YegP (UPF0339 family)